MYSVWKRAVRTGITQEMVCVGFKAWALETDCLDSDLFSTAQHSCDHMYKFPHLRNGYKDGTKLTGLL